MGFFIMFVFILLNILNLLFYRVMAVLEPLKVTIQNFDKVGYMHHVLRIYILPLSF